MIEVRRSAARALSGPGPAAAGEKETTKSEEAICPEQDCRTYVSYDETRRETKRRFPHARKRFSVQLEDNSDLQGSDSP